MMAASRAVFAAQEAQTPARPRLAAPALYAQACALSHGADGKGSSTWQGEVPVPDFTDCLTNTDEPALSQALGPPRSAWVPAFELVGSLDLHTHEDDWGALLEMSKPLTSLGHVIVSIGVRLPMTKTAEKYRIQAYQLWDFGDGPFWKGW
jgi:hypothetical protein